MTISTLTLNPALDRSMIFEDFRAGQLNRAMSSVTTVGGKGINVSRVLNACGVQTVAYGFYGGQNGETMQRMLETEGVSYNFTRTRAETRMNIKLLTTGGEATEASESGGPVTADELDELLTKLDYHFRNQKPHCFVISGSAPRGIDVSVYGKIVNNARENGIKTVLDCDREALKQGISASPYLIKPNLFELEQYAGRKLLCIEEIINFTLRLHRETGIKILLTLAEKGAMYIGHEGVYTVSSPKVQMRGFTGAGDSFLAAFLSSYEDGGSIETALRHASSFAAAKVELEGTKIPDVSGKTKYFDVIKVEKII
ncbi:MAG: 1-phosphofructokinase family hexose kinase [Ruminococcaceae bacterium]|nr:1-phosphofructokinase family hexose kinase [Oscillospiraceae bacterium]